MKTPQKLLFFCIITAIILGFAATAVLAQNPPELNKTINLSDKLSGVGAQAGFNTSEGVDLPILIGRIIQAFLSLLGIIFMGYVVYAGSLWLTARGDESKIEKAKTIIRGSIIGLIIVLSAYAITGFVLYRLVLDTGFGVKAGS